jgi:radical SAM superfamily enzyme YgiQ (UPF0313 family)
MSKKSILLIDVDSQIPNLALMKLYSYFKNKGYHIDFKKLNRSYFSRHNEKIIIDASDYEKVFISVIFSNNKNIVKVENCDDVVYGGVGYDYTIKLPEEIDCQKEDYSIYPDSKYSYGFITRGCIRNCEFCIVPKSEGRIYKYRNIDDIIQHKQVKFLDNNILAYKDHESILQELIDKKIKCQFNQGLDIRLINERNALLLSKLNYLGEYIFAFDDVKNKSIIERKLAIVKKYITGDWRLKFYLYCHPSMDIKNDVVYRVEWCRENKVLPYLMRNRSCWESDYKGFYNDLCAWCNQPHLFKKMTFEEFMKKRTKNVNRIETNIKLYNGMDVEKEVKWW